MFSLSLDVKHWMIPRPNKACCYDRIRRNIWLRLIVIYAPKSVTIKITSSSLYRYLPNIASITSSLSSPPSAAVSPENLHLTLTKKRTTINSSTLVPPKSIKVLCPLPALCSPLHMVVCCLETIDNGVIFFERQQRW